MNPGYQELMGLKCYPSLLDIPHPVDHVIVETPARVVPDVARDHKGARAVHVYSSGFSETGRWGQAGEGGSGEDGGKLKLMGPNGMEVWCLESGLFINGQPQEEDRWVSSLRAVPSPSTPPQRGSWGRSGSR